jgi:hypothetical protein
MDRSTAVYETFAEEYVIPNGTCGVERTTLISGQPGAFEAEEVTATIDNGRTVTYESVGDGRYEPQAAPLPGVFDGATQVEYAIVGSGDIGTLADTTAVTPAPTAILQAQPTPGTQLFLSIPFTLTWAGQGMPPMGRRTVVELYDDLREVRLFCRIMDTGSFTLPNDAVQDFMDENPTPPLTLELRYEYLTIGFAGIDGTGDQLPINFRTAKGVRWPIQ